MPNDKKERQWTLDEGPSKKDIPDPRNTLNDLTNTEWMFFSRNVWTTTYPNELGFQLRKKQGGNKPPRLMSDLIKMFTKKGELVLDPMCGVGGTLLGCSISGRNGLGLEINPSWVEIYRQVCNQEGLVEFPVRIGDCLELLDAIEPNSVDLVVVDPPYREDTKWDRTMSNGTYATRIANLPERYSTNEKDFGNLMDYSEFLASIKLLSSKVKRVLKEEKYFVVFAKDEYQNGEFREKSTIMAHTVRFAGFQWKSKITWYQAGAKLRPYGVPYSFVPNITDQKILIFKNSTHVGRERPEQSDEGALETESDIQDDGSPPQITG